MKKNMYIIPATETIEIKACGVLMGSKDAFDDPGDPEPGQFQTGAPRKKVF